MIRDYAPTDWAPVSDMLRASQPWEIDGTREMLMAGKALVYDNGQVNGIAILQVHRGEGRVTGNLVLFTAPVFRRQGAGSALFNRVSPELARLQGALVWTHFPAESTETDRFLTARGFKKVVDTLTMSYRGPAFEEPALDIQPYRDEDFADYITINNEAFSDVRKAAGLDPHVFPDTALMGSALRREVQSRSEEIWLLWTGARAVGLVELCGSSIETVAIRPGYQGHGHGRQLARFGVNRVLQRGGTEVTLEVGEPNRPARALYVSLGFAVARSTRRSRLIVP